MSVNDQDFDAVKEAIETLEDNGFEVESVDRVFGFDDIEYDPETEEETELGRLTNITLAIEKEHY